MKRAELRNWGYRFLLCLISDGLTSFKDIQMDMDNAPVISLVLLCALGGDDHGRRFSPVFSEFSAADCDGKNNVAAVAGDIYF